MKRRRNAVPNASMRGTIFSLPDKLQRLMLDIRKGIAVTAHAALRKAFDNRMIYVM